MTSNEPEATTHNETNRQTILLVVDDDEDIGEFIAQALKDETPYQVLHMTDAARALEAVNSIKPSLFILDYSLPGIDGLKLADHLHLVEGLETIPIVMMSAVSPPAKEMRKRKITFLSKPFELNDLFANIEKLLAEQNK